MWYSNADVLTKDKLTELKCRIKNNSTPPHVIAISEVKPKHFKRQLTLQEYNLEGYSMETINMNENKGRRMILFIHNSLPFQAHHFEVDFNEALFCTLKGKETLLVGSFYRSPNSNTENNDNLNELLEKISEKISHVLLGDFNYPKIDWKIMSTTVSSIEDKEFKFIEKLRDCYFIQHISEPTRGRGTTKPSLIDLVITSEDFEIELIETASALGKSDHSIIKVILNCTPIHESIRKTVYKYDKGDYPKLEDMLSIDWDEEFSKHEGDVQAQRDIFTIKIREAVERCIPKKVMSERTKKYPVPLNVKIRAKIRRKNRLWKKYLLTRDVQAYQEYCRLRNQVRRLTRKAQKIYEKKYH